MAGPSCGSCGNAEIRKLSAIVRARTLGETPTRSVRLLPVVALLVLAMAADGAAEPSKRSDAATATPPNAAECIEKANALLAEGKFFQAEIEADAAAHMGADVRDLMAKIAAARAAAGSQEDGKGTVGESEPTQNSLDHPVTPSRSQEEVRAEIRKHLESARRLARKNPARSLAELKIAEALGAYGEGLVEEIHEIEDAIERTAVGAKLLGRASTVPVAAAAGSRMSAPEGAAPDIWSRIIQDVWSGGNENLQMKLSNATTVLNSSLGEHQLGCTGHHRLSGQALLWSAAESATQLEEAARRTADADARARYRRLGAKIAGVVRKANVAEPRGSSLIDSCHATWQRMVRDGGATPGSEAHAALRKIHAAADTCINEIAKLVTLYQAETKTCTALTKEAQAALIR